MIPDPVLFCLFGFGVISMNKNDGRFRWSTRKEPRCKHNLWESAAWIWGEAEHLFNLLDYDGSGRFRTPQLERRSERKERERERERERVYKDMRGQYTVVIGDLYVDWTTILEQLHKLRFWCCLEQLINNDKHSFHLHQILVRLVVTFIVVNFSDAPTPFWAGEVSYPEFVDGCWKLQGEACEGEIEWERGSEIVGGWGRVIEI